MRVHTVTAVLSRMVRCVADSATTAKAIDHHDLKFEDSAVQPFFFANPLES